MSFREPGTILLVSCYELGHQPLGIALPLAFLERAGFSPDILDIALDKLEIGKIARANFVGISVPMHTALRLGVRIAERIREVNPHVIICFFGLYAALNCAFLLDRAASYCIGGEFEEPLVRLVEAIESHSMQSDTKNPAPRVAVEGVIQRGESARPFLGRLSFPVPSRDALPPLDRYARLEWEGQRRVVGYVEASRGCLHLCTHCPIPPVYGGRFFVIPQEVVLQDVRQQVRAGATHITFGDPDFLNGPGHSLNLVRAMHAEFPDLTFDFTAKVEHVLEHQEQFPELGELGCLFMVSAVESLSETVLAILEKGHSRADVVAALAVCRGAGITLRPTWVPFTPWSTLNDYLEIFEFIESNDIIDHVDPVQYTIRLLVPPGSYLVDRPAMKPHLGPLDQASFSFRWTHPDIRMDRLQKEAHSLLESDTKMRMDPAETFYRLWNLALRAGGDTLRTIPECAPDQPAGRVRAPRLTEPWFC